MATTRFWSAATWSVPIAVQPVSAVLLLAMWLLGKAGLRNDTFDAQRNLLLFGTGITLLVSFAVAGLLLRRTSPTTRGLGLGAAASAVVVAIGAVAYAFWLF